MPLRGKRGHAVGCVMASKIKKKRTKSPLCSCDCATKVPASRIQSGQSWRVCVLQKYVVFYSTQCMLRAVSMDASCRPLGSTESWSIENEVVSLKSSHPRVFKNAAKEAMSKLTRSLDDSHSWTSFGQSLECDGISVQNMKPTTQPPHLSVGGVLLT